MKSKKNVVPEQGQHAGFFPQLCDVYMAKLLIVPPETSNPKVAHMVLRQRVSPSAKFLAAMTPRKIPGPVTCSLVMGSDIVEHAFPTKIALTCRSSLRPLKSVQG
jgi:hypothetical protein